MFFKDGILGMLPEADMLQIGNQVQRQGDPIDSIFGDERTESIVARWQTLASEYQIPAMAQYHAFDVEAQKTIRVPIDTHNVEKGLIKVKNSTTEVLRTAMKSGIQANNDEALWRYVMDDAANLADQVITRTKVAKNELLATGHITIAENNLSITVDYGVPSANLTKTLDFGAGASADVPSQLEDIIEGARDNGTILNGFLTSSKVLNKLRKNANIQRAIYGNNGAGVLVKNADLRAYLSSEFGLDTILVNDLMYSEPYTLDTSTHRPVVTKARYYPQSKVSFFAANMSGLVGTGLWGDPPEVDVQNLVKGTSDLSQYVYISQWNENDPAELWTKASALFMPVLFNPDGLYVATVQETAAQG